MNAIPDIIPLQLYIFITITEEVILPLDMSHGKTTFLGTEIVPMQASTIEEINGRKIRCVWTRTFDIFPFGKYKDEKHMDYLVRYELNQNKCEVLVENIDESDEPEYPEEI